MIPINSGLDPEALVLDGDGFIIPASRFLPPPTRQYGERLNHVSYDNAAVEMRPYHTSRTSRLTARLGSLIHSVMTDLGVAMQRGYVPRHAYLSLTPAGRLRDEDRDLESVSQFGCSPSLTLTDDFTSLTTVPDVSADETDVRSAGFHIHQEIPAMGTSLAVVGVLDGLLGLLDIRVNDRLGLLDASRMRRLDLGYGRAGEHRIRRGTHSSILEYRSLSPWPLANPTLTAYVITLSRQVCRLSRVQLLRILNDFPDRRRITRAINGGNPYAAAALHSRCVAVWDHYREEETGAEPIQEASVLDYISVRDQLLRRSEWH